MRLLLLAFVLSAANCLAAESFGMGEIAPCLQQLGAGWTSNNIVVLVDSSTPGQETCTEGKGWLDGAHRVMGKNGREAYMVLRYHYNANGSTGSALVWVNRFDTAHSIGDNWGRDKATKAAMPELPRVGDEVRFYQRDRLHNNIAFRRDRFLVDVEGVSVPVEKLKELALAVDNNLLRRQTGPNPKARSKTLSAEGYSWNLGATLVNGTNVPLSDVAIRPGTNRVPQ